jgi:hypothetical protein
VCFDEPRQVSGRFAIVYDPVSLFDHSRALYYFDH